MTLEQFLTLISTILGAIGSIYVLKSILRLTVQDIKRLSTQTYGHDPNKIDSLSNQKSESVVGAILIIFALLISIINSAFTPSNYIVSTNKCTVILIAIVLTGIVSFLMILIGKYVFITYCRSVIKTIIIEKLDTLFRSNSVTSHDIKSLQLLAGKYFCMKLKTSATSMDILCSISKIVGRTIPAGIQIEDEIPTKDTNST